MSIFISPAKSGSTSIGKALQLCGFSSGGWQPSLFSLDQYASIITANRLVAQYQSVSAVPVGVRCYLMRDLAFVHHLAHTKDCWDDWPLAHECIDPILKKIVIHDAKFIFSLREPKSWLRSMAGHYKSTGLSYDSSFQDYCKHLYALWLHRILCVKREFPQDVLLYDIKEGWKPLSKFLGIKAPKIAFPKENVSQKN